MFKQPLYKDNLVFQSFAVLWLKFMINIEYQMNSSSLSDI